MTCQGLDDGFHQIYIEHSFQLWKLRCCRSPGVHHKRLWHDTRLARRTLTNSICHMLLCFSTNIWLLGRSVLQEVPHDVWHPNLGCMLICSFFHEGISVYAVSFGTVKLQFCRSQNVLLCTFLFDQFKKI